MTRIQEKRVLRKALKALRPFGEFPFFEDLEDDVVLFQNSGAAITAGDMRAAKAAVHLLEEVE